VTEAEADYQREKDAHEGAEEARAEGEAAEREGARRQLESRLADPGAALRPEEQAMRDILRDRAFDASVERERRVMANLGAKEPAQMRAASSKSGRGTPLSVVVDKWAAENKPTDRFIRRTRNIVDRFEAVAGRVTVEEVTKEQVLAFKDQLVAKGQTAANINVMLPILGTVFNYAVDKLHLIQTNPAAKVRVADNRRAKDKRRAFEADELKALFSSPVYADGKRPQAGGGEAAYWLPLLALYTGARQTELGQLHPEDVVQEGYRDTDDKEQTAWVIRIVENTERGQRLKTEGSERRVPVHADLIALGFIRYAERAKAKGQSRLFPDITPNAEGELMGTWSKWFNRYLRRAVGVTDKRVVFHSFRHSFKHFARLASIPNDVHNEITGHETGDVADSYGGLSYPLAPLVDAIKRYRVPGFTLPAAPKGYAASAGA
jgi:integrase